MDQKFKEILFIFLQKLNKFIANSISLYLNSF